MSRRKLRIVYSSSDDDDQLPPQQPPQSHPSPEFDDDNDVVFQDATLQHQQLAFEDDDVEEIEDFMPNISAVTLNSTTTTATETTTAAAVVISDEEFIDVADNLSPPSPPHTTPSVTTTATITTPFSASDCPVNDFLRKIGLSLRREWLDSCQLGLQNSTPNFRNLDVENKAKLCLGQVLCSDLNKIGAGGVLPHNVCGLHHVDLAGPFVLQVDEIVNISCPLRERYKNAAPGLKRCLKLSMTDGVQRVFGMEYRPIKSLEALAPAGFKVVVRNVNVRRGILMLVPEVIEVLGGSVQELEEARQRLVQEVTKPPRGKRTRNGVVPPLATRATQAAWPQNGTSNNSAPANASNSGPRNTTGSAVHTSAQLLGNAQGTNNIATSNQVSQPFSAGRESMGLSYMVEADQSFSRESGQHSVRRESGQQFIESDPAQHSLRRESGQQFVESDPVQHSVRRESGQHSVRRESGQQFVESDPVQHSVRRDSGLNSDYRVSGQQSSTESAQLPVVRETAHFTTVVQEARELPLSRAATDPLPCRESIAFSTAAIVDEDACMVDNNDAKTLEHPFILSKSKEAPFTYMASLSIKWYALQAIEPFVRGKIKCFLTGVKRFEYQQPTYNLRVHVDDGSHVSLVHIHHNVVQSTIGFSPEEVTAALRSSDTQVRDRMRSNMMKFQLFLLNFEGTMLVEYNKSSDIPVALEMNEGCSNCNSVAWSLLRRAKRSVPTLPLQVDLPNTIHLSP